MVRLQTIYLSKECNPEVLAKKSFTTSHHINNLVVRFSQTVVRQWEALRVEYVHRH